MNRSAIALLLGLTACPKPPADPEVPPAPAVEPDDEEPPIEIGAIYGSPDMMGMEEPEKEPSEEEDPKKPTLEKKPAADPIPTGPE